MRVSARSSMMVGMARATTGAIIAICQVGNTACARIELAMMVMVCICLSGESV
jgi:hypothetical protein